MQDKILNHLIHVSINPNINSVPSDFPFKSVQGITRDTFASDTVSISMLPQCTIFPTYGFGHKSLQQRIKLVCLKFERITISPFRAMAANRLLVSSNFYLHSLLELGCWSCLLQRWSSHIKQLFDWIYIHQKYHIALAPTDHFLINLWSSSWSLSRVA